MKIVCVYVSEMYSTTPLTFILHVFFVFFFYLLQEQEQARRREYSKGELLLPWRWGVTVTALVSS
jgi:hypothetical protein